MAVVNPDKIAEVLAECSALYVMPRYQLLEDHEIFSKTSPHDLVTQADMDVEEHLKKVLPDFLPGSVVIGEESVSKGEDTLDILKDDKEKIWVVDPVDGTYNFVHHNREFGIMLALVIGGETVGSWIFDVLGHNCAISEKNAGAFIDGQRLQVAREVARDDLIGHVNPKYFPEKHRAHVKKTRKAFTKCHTFGCSAHEYLNIACGQAHFSLYSLLKPWDHLSGALMVREAGGIARLWDGTPYMPGHDDVGLIVANDDDVWHEVRDLFITQGGLDRLPELDYAS